MIRRQQIWHCPLIIEQPSDSNLHPRQPKGARYGADDSWSEDDSMSPCRHSKNVRIVYQNGNLPLDLQQHSKLLQQIPAYLQMNRTSEAISAKQVSTWMHSFNDIHTHLSTTSNAVEFRVCPANHATKGTAQIGLVFIDCVSSTHSLRQVRMSW